MILLIPSSPMPLRILDSGYPSLFHLLILRPVLRAEGGLVDRKTLLVLEIGVLRRAVIAVFEVLRLVFAEEAVSRREEALARSCHLRQQPDRVPPRLAAFGNGAQELNESDALGVPEFGVT